MFTDEIQVILDRALSPTQTKFLGVFEQDRIPAFDSLDHFPCCFVANTDPHGQPGTHWVAFFLDSSSQVEFFDSYGLHPSVYLFPSTSTYNTSQFQSPRTQVCGQYSIYYLHQRSNKQTLSSISNHLKSLSSCTDPFVKKFVALLIASFYLTLPAHPSGQSCQSQQ